MRSLLVALAAAALAASAPALAAETVLPMTPAQQAQFKTEHDAAKAQWAKLTPEQQAALVKSASQKKQSELTAMERVGQRNDMLRETQQQSAALKAQSDAAKASYAQLSAEQKAALKKSAWQKRRDELSGMEAVGQRDDMGL